MYQLVLSFPIIYEQDSLSSWQMNLYSGNNGDIIVLVVAGELLVEVYKGIFEQKCFGCLTTLPTVGKTLICISPWFRTLLHPRRTQSKNLISKIGKRKETI